MKKFWLSSSWNSDVKKGKVDETLTRKVFHEKDVKKTNVATNRAYRAYMQVQSDILTPVPQINPSFMSRFSILVLVLSGLRPKTSVQC